MFNRKKRGRSVNGILLLDKPLGFSSNAALQKVKRLYQAQKAGHTGSLDPLATGMLPICFGHATKLSQYLLDADKRYLVTGRLGVKTTTADAEGSVVSERDVKVTADQLEAALSKFRGAITQVPSMYSALKHEGRPLYELARQGIEIERPARSVTIHELTLLSFEAPFVTLEVHCTKGTYVRNLIEDLGEALGCGAHVSFLRRLSAGAYQPEQMVTEAYLTELAEAENFEALDNLLLPMDSVVEYLPRIDLAPSAAFQLQQGNSVQVLGQEKRGLVRIYNQADQLLGIGEITEEGLLAPSKVFL